MTTATFSLKGIPSVSIADARATLSELVGRARHAKSPTVLTSRGKPVAAMVSIEDLELIEEAIDQRLAADARTRIRRGEMPMSWEKAKSGTEHEKKRIKRNRPKRHERNKPWPPIASTGLPLGSPISVLAAG